jgi:hypothetical protein
MSSVGFIAAECSYVSETQGSVGISASRVPPTFMIAITRIAGPANLVSAPSIQLDEIANGVGAET